MSNRRLPRLAMILIVLAAAPTMALGQQEETASRAVFTPTLFLLASNSNNEYRTVSAPIGDSSLYSELELPFVFRGPRWNGGFSLNPAWRQYQDLDALDQLETSVSGWASGSLSQRTTMRFVAAGVYSPQLTGLDGPDIIAPRAQRFRSQGLVGLRHRLSPVGDALDFEAEYGSIQYLDDDFVSERSYGLQGTYIKALDARLAATASGRIDRVEYAGSSWVNSVTPLLGLVYRVGPRTELDVNGGVSFSRRGGLGGDGGDGSTTTDVFTTTSFSGHLRHSGQHWTMSLDATRQVASGVALGQPTVRSQLAGSYGYQQGRFRFGLTAGAAFNELLDSDGTAIILTPEGLLATTATEVRTLATCMDAAYRLSGWMSLVVAGRLGKQLPTGAPEALELDVYRVSAGISLHPYAPPAASAAGAAVLTRYGRAGSLGAC